MFRARWWLVIDIEGFLDGLFDGIGFGSVDGSGHVGAPLAGDDLASLVKGIGFGHLGIAAQWRLEVLAVPEFFAVVGAKGHERAYPLVGNGKRCRGESRRGATSAVGRRRAAHRRSAG